jgi:hypothetical protein
MKHCARYAPVLLLMSSLAAQSGFSQLQSITAGADRPTAIDTADLDGDGRPDVISSSSSDNKIAWYRNLGGGRFGPEQVLSTAALRAQSVLAADLDGDRLVDVISLSIGDDKVAWYRNLGRGAFGREVVISTAIGSPYTARAVDLDGDSDLDLLVGYATTSGQLVWFENRGSSAGSTIFAAPRTINAGLRGLSDVQAADLDSDGDADVLVSTTAALGAVWIPNLGNGAFGAPRTISTASPTYYATCAADVDGDRALDVLTASQTGGELAWHRNLGAGRFGPQQMISIGVAGCRDVTAADFDGDGDLDVAAIGSGAFDQVAWFENLGGGNFGPLRGIEAGNSAAIRGGVAIHADDLNEDGAADVLVVASSNDVVGWYTNLLATVESFGVGCGTQPLTQRPLRTPVLGTAAQAEIRNVPGTLCVLMAGLDRGTHPLFGALPFSLDAVGMQGCALLQSGEVPAVPTTPTATPGVFTWSMPLAANPAFQGMAFYTQAFAPAPRANQLGLIASNGVAWRLGL